MNHIDLMLTYFMAYLSAGSAFLAVAGARIPPFLARVIVAGYTLASVTLIVSLQRIAQIAIEIRDALRGAIDWHPSV
ncbi:MAG: hypothetical protein ACI9BW_002359 [Gammaproteobacteria bacterium]|jgi:hypothetical protein